MSTGREIRCFDYVNHPYEQVRETLTKNALAVFQSATKAAASRVRSVASELRVEIGGFAVEADVMITITKIEETARDATAGAITRLRLEWQAAKLPSLFPLMKGTLSIYPLTSTETQLDFFGLYEPPLGAVGKALNAIVGHRIAEVSVHRFVGDVAGYLTQTLA